MRRAIAMMVSPVVLTMRHAIRTVAYILPLLLGLLLSSCQKVIDLPVKDTVEKYIIEGNITDLPGPYRVLISRTGKLGEDSRFDGVAHATVTLRDDAGGSETLQEMEAGIYQTSGMQGACGRTYTLDVLIGTQAFVSVSAMPYRVNLDSLYTEELVNFTKTVTAAVPLFTDPPATGNCYRFNQYINGVLDKTLYYMNDDFTNGKQSTWALLRPDPDSTLHVNDRVDVEMQCIDEPVYKYWFSADQSAVGEPSSVPSNPVTNIRGGALGYFSAHTSQTRSLYVK